MPEWVIQLLVSVFVSGAVYGGIRANQQAMMRDIVRHEKAIERVHKRLDDCGVCTGRRHDD